MSTTNHIPTDPRFRDLTGKTFGRWLVVKFAGRKTCGFFWKCLCECGVVKIVNGPSLKRGETKSCGCFARDNPSALVHGGCRKGIVSKEFVAWVGIKQRCNKHFPNYGARGINICTRWRESFESFLSDMGKSPSPKHSIERIDNDGNYEPENCRWVTQKEQARNRRSNRLLTRNGKTATLAEWAELSGVNRATIWSRLRRRWSVDEAIFTPIDKKKRNHLARKR